MGKSYTHLSLVERALLQTRLVLRWSPAAIAAGLQRVRSTISREMARNGWQSEPKVALRGRPRAAGGYRAEAAQKRASALSSKPRVVRKLVLGNALFGLIVAHLRRGLSPEQIAFTLGCMDKPVRLSHETIYTALYAMPRGQLRARILTLLHLHYLERPYLSQFTDFPVPVLQHSISGSGISISEVRKLYAQTLFAGVDEINYKKLTVKEIRQQWSDAWKAAGAKYIAAPGCSVPNDSTPEELARFPQSLGIELA